MSECKKTENGRSVEMCEPMQKAFQMGFVEDAIKTATLKESGEKISRVCLILPMRKKKYAEISFCLFCGADIDTSDYGFGVEE